MVGATIYIGFLSMSAWAYRHVPGRNKRLRQQLFHCSYRFLMTQFRRSFWADSLEICRRGGTLDHLARLHNVALSPYTSGR